MAKQLESSGPTPSLKSQPLLPGILAQNISILQPVLLGAFVIMRTPKRFYIGEVLNLYKRGIRNNSRYGSIEKATSVGELSWLSLRVFLPLQLMSPFCLTRRYVISHRTS